MPPRRLIGTFKPMRRAIGSAFLLAIVGLLGLILGRSIAAPPTTQEILRQSEIDSGVDRIVEQTDFLNTPLKEVIASLQKQTKANLVVHWHVLEAAGIEDTVPITLKLGQLPVGRVLEIVGELAGGGTVKMGYEVDRGVITFSTEEDLERDGGELRIYDVRDLVVADMKRQAPTGGGTDCFPATQPQTLFGDGGHGYQIAVDNLKQIVMHTVDPESWRDAGGTLGSMFDFNGRLLITQTPENHTAITKLLELIRKG